MVLSKKEIEYATDVIDLECLTHSTEELQKKLTELKTRT